MTPTEQAVERVGGHTPGPWVYRTGMPYDWGWVTDAEGGFIAQAKDPAARDDEALSRHRAAKTDPWAANATLIASAPDLLDSLKRNRAALDLIDPARPLQFAQTMDLMRKDMDAALSRATGGAG